jgi:hypothetical protein
VGSFEQFAHQGLSGTIGCQLEHQPIALNRRVQL